MNLNLEGQIRDKKGTGASNAIRKEKMIPGVIYGRGEDTVLVKVNEIDFKKVFKEAGTATIVGLQIDGKEVPVLIKDTQKHHIKDTYLHVDFQKISMDEEVRVILPVIIENRDLIKIQPSTLSQQLDELEISCLPKYLPDEDIFVDVKDMEIGDSILVGDLDIAKDENINVHRELDDVVCSLSAFVEEKEEDLEDSVDGDVEPELVTQEEEE